MRAFTLKLMVLALFLSVVAARAQVAPPELAAEEVDARVKAVAPYIDPQTFGIVHVDTARVDAGALVGKLAELGVPLEPDVTGLRQKMSLWLTQFRAAGGQHIYLIFSMAGLKPNEPLIVVPIEPGGDAATMAQMLRGRADAAGNVVIAGREVRPMSERSDVIAIPDGIRDAFAGAGDTVAQAIFLLNKDYRRVIAETMPVLPPELGGGSSAPISEGFLWAALGGNGPPELTVTLVIGCPSAAAATALNDALTRIKDAVGREPGVRNAVPAYDELAKLLTPVVVGDRLVLTLDDGQVTRIFKIDLAPPLAQARREAMQSASRSNIHQLLMSCAEYAANHNGEWPDDLNALIPDGYLADKALLKNPIRPELEMGYEYIKPAQGAPADTIVIFEKFDEWPEGGVNTGRKDLAVLCMRNEWRLRSIFLLGDPEKLKAKLQADPDLALAADGYGQTLLHCAARDGNMTAVKVLLDKGAEVNAIDNQGRTPLQFAVKGGHEEVAKLLRQHGGIE